MTPQNKKKSINQRSAFSSALSQSCSRRLSAECYSVKTTDCTPEISNLLRQRMFLQAIRSSFRSM